MARVKRAVNAHKNAVLFSIVHPATAVSVPRLYRKAKGAGHSLAGLQLRPPS